VCPPRVRVPHENSLASVTARCRDVKQGATGSLGRMSCKKHGTASGNVSCKRARRPELLTKTSQQGASTQQMRIWHPEGYFIWSKVRWSRARFSRREEKNGSRLHTGSPGTLQGSQAETVSGRALRFLRSPTVLAALDPIRRQTAGFPARCRICRRGIKKRCVRRNAVKLRDLRHKTV
jgi:hypothetical protein